MSGLNPSASENEIYEDHVLPHYEDPYHRGHCETTTHAHQGDNPLCGDVVRVELELDDQGRVRQAWFDGHGCTVSQASASMLMEKIEGLSLDEVKQFSAEDMLHLFQASLTPNRQKCCLLSWRVLQGALHSPVDESSTDKHDSEDDDDDRSAHLGGPSLSEES